jgi:glycerol-3-phosphate cytidylyltransferase
MKKIGYTSGVFDLFHVGHLNILRRAKMECDYLVVAITTDELAIKKLGKRLVIPFEERMEIVQHIDFVDEVVPQTNMNKLNAYNNIKFDKMFVGDDWKDSKEWDSLEKTFKQLNVEIIYFPYTKHTSSSTLRDVLERL